MLINIITRLCKCRGSITKRHYCKRVSVRQLCGIAEFDQMFKGKQDRYNGVIVNSTHEPCDLQEFSKRLKVSLEEWMKLKKNTIWFEVDAKDSNWIPLLIAEDFKFHHTKEDVVTLYKWLREDAICNIPSYAHTNIGIGAFVYDDDTKKLLVVKQHYATNNWKLPGGFVDPKENLGEAVEREVLEETGITAKFKCLLGFRHLQNYNFGCADMYFLAHLTPLSQNIKIDQLEISECVWMSLEEYATHPQVHDNNKFAARTMIEHLKSGIGITALEAGIHPVAKTPVMMYTIHKVN